MSSISIAERVLDINHHDFSDSSQAVMHAFNHVTGQHLDAAEFSDLLQEIENGIDPHRPDWHVMMEYGTAIYDIQSIMIAGPEEPPTINTLVSWPRYQKLMEKHGNALGGTALMIGSHSPLSSASFHALAAEVYKAEHSVVVDLKGSKAHVASGNFVQGNGLALPVRSGAVNYVHTNMLFHQLVDPTTEATATRPKIKRLLREIGRVLAPGGQLFMQETEPSIEHNMSANEAEEKQHALATFMIKVMQQAGFTAVYPEFAMLYRGTGYLHSKRREFKKFEIAETPASFVLFACKRNDSDPPLRFAV